MQGFAAFTRYLTGWNRNYPPLARVKLRIAACNAPVARIFW